MAEWQEEMSRDEIQLESPASEIVARLEELYQGSTHAPLKLVDCGECEVLHILPRDTDENSRRGIEINIPPHLWRRVQKQ